MEYTIFAGGGSIDNIHLYLQHLSTIVLDIDF